MSVLDGATPEHWAKAVENDGLVWRHVNRRPSLTPEQREDAHQDGLMGLVRAAMLFDESRGFTFATYADAWVRQYIAKGLGRAEGSNYRRAQNGGHLGDYEAPTSLDFVIDEGGTTSGDVLPDPTTDVEGHVMWLSLVDEVRAACRDELDEMIAERVVCGGRLGSAALGDAHGVPAAAVRRRKARLLARVRDELVAA